MPKSSKKAPKKDFWPLFIILAVLAVFLLWQSKKTPVLPKIKEDISQLSSTSGVSGNATAVRSYSEGNFRLNVTAFLPKTGINETYAVRLVSDTLEPKTIEAGSLNSAGDVFALGYESSADYTAYSVLEIVLLNKITQEENLVLKGSF